VAPPDTYREELEKLRSGGYGYSDLKKRLFELYWERFAEACRRRAVLEADPGYIEQVMRKGAERARAIATKVDRRARRARRACGLE